jgi:hypothetical protein
MLRRLKSKYTLVVIASAIFLYYCSPGGPLDVQVLPADAKSSICLPESDPRLGPGFERPSDPLTPAEFNTWFVSGSVSLNGVVQPANSVQFEDRPNITFYKWAEQMFLAYFAAPPSYGVGNNLIFNSGAFFDVSAPDPVSGKRHFIYHQSGFIRAFDIRSINRGILDLPIVLNVKL